MADFMIPSILPQIVPGLGGDLRSQLPVSGEGSFALHLDRQIQAGRTGQGNLMGVGGKALDLRYKVTDVTKATSLLYLTNHMYIFNHSNKKVLIVPFQRENQTSQKLVEGRTYFALLPNKEERVQSGNTVSVVLGGSRAENLVVN